MPIQVIQSNNRNTARTGRLRGGRMVEMSVDEAMHRFQTVARSHRDFYLRGRDITMRPDGTFSLGDKGIFTFDDLSFSQFCGKMKVPTDFVRSSPDGSGPASKKAIIDHWRERIEGRTFLVRTRILDQPDVKTGAVGQVRGFLGDRYGVLDNTELLELLHPYIAQNDMTLMVGQGSEHNKTAFMRIVSRTPVEVGTLHTGAPDLHQMGMSLQNSEVGASNCQGDFLIYRQICSNGLVSLVEDDHLFTQQHRNVERSELRIKISSALTLVGERCEEMRDRLLTAKETLMPNPTREMNRFLRANRATEDFIELAEKAYDEEPNPTRFGIIQAITLAAQRLPHEQRLQMESVAGRFLN